MDILREPLIEYIRIISKKYKIPQKKIKPLIEDSWVFLINGDVSKEELYMDKEGNKYIIIDENTAMQLLY